MSKKAVVISTSLRTNSNSAALAECFCKGAKEAGNDVEYISLKGKKIGFCEGCFACLSTGSCVIEDDALEITEKVLNADVVAFATPIYYYEMSGQMKTLIDRMNSLYPKDYKFRDIYFMSAAAEDEDFVPERAVAGLQGWIDCYEHAELKGTLFCGGVNDAGDIQGNDKLTAAYEMGKNIQVVYMAKWIKVICAVLFICMLTACGSTDSKENADSNLETDATETETTEVETADMNNKMYIEIGDYTFTATLEDNKAVAELLAMIEEGPVRLELEDYSGFEKVGPLGKSLTRCDKQTTTKSGDIVLYNGNNIVIFYGSNSWSYTRIGKVDNLTDWEKALGTGDVTVNFRK